VPTLLEKRLLALEAARHTPTLPPDAVSLAAAAGYPVLDDWQREVLTGQWQRLLLNISRQVGKSTITALLALDTALRTPRTLVLVLSPGERQSAELLDKCRQAHAALGRGGLVAAPAAEGALHLRLANASRILALPGRDGATVRGFSAPALVILDEAARVQDSLYHAVAPMLSMGHGRLVMLSTPAGKRGVFFDSWEHSGDDWQRIEVKAAACPRYDRAFLEQERRGLPPWVYAAEYECAFTEAEGAVFADADIRAALDPTVVPLPGYPYLEAVS
jgi:hypothetical protein